MIKRLLLQVYHFCSRIKANYHHWRDTKETLAKSRSQLYVPELPLGKYLVLIPHSDDEWIGNSTIISNKEYEVELFDMDMPGGDSDEIHKARFSEMKVTSQKYDRKLHSKKNNESLLEVIDRFHPDYVTVPYFFDWHPEHRKVMVELSAICGEDKSFKVAMYQVTVPIASQNVTNANRMDKKHWKLKWRWFRKTYKTQSFFPAYRVASQERINGKMVGEFSAEFFSLMNNQQWAAFIEKNLPGHEMMGEIRGRISSISSLRSLDQPSIMNCVL